MSFDLANKYRPKTLDDVVGQDDVVKTLKGYFANGGLPHCVMLSGPSGTGKTTLARILANMLGCKGGDLLEINCATEVGKEQMYDVPGHITLYPTGKARLCYLDEFQSLSRAKFAQQSMLKVTEDYPKHAYFVIASTDPTKIIPAIHTRFETLKLRDVAGKELDQLLLRVLEAEGRDVSDAVLSAVIDAANGSPRAALKALERVLLFEDEQDQLRAAGDGEALARGVGDLLKMLMFQWKPVPKWPDVAALLTEMREHDPETVRRALVKAATTHILKAGNSSERAAAVLRAFQYSTDEAGFGKITLAAWDLFGAGK